MQVLCNDNILTMYNKCIKDKNIHRVYISINILHITNYILYIQYTMHIIHYYIIMLIISYSKDNNTLDTNILHTIYYLQYFLL